SLMDELTRVETNQRHALALELHDNLAQRLASLFNSVQHCSHLIERDVQAAKEELEHLRQVSSESLRDARTMIRDLHFGVSSGGPGLSTLVDYLADLDADTGIRHEADVVDSLPDLPPTQESLILRVIQEALRNAHKHAIATQITVTVRSDGSDLLVEIRDDGRGFELEEALARSQRRGRLGLIGMRERAGLLGGELTVASTPGAGTTVQLRVPLTGKGIRRP
ncbi:MAG: sensor histidine kinase, partial [Dehalococcoidia bacterium]